MKPIERTLAQRLADANITEHERYKILLALEIAEEVGRGSNRETIIKKYGTQIETIFKP